jgi:hypothetical protein
MNHTPTSARYFAEYETVHGTDHITVTRDGQQEPVFTAELPYDADRNAGQALYALGWRVIGMDAYAGPTFFRAVVEPATPAAPRLMPDQARAAVTPTCPDAQDFQPVHDADGRFLGYTFAADTTPTPRFGWITNASTYSKGLEPNRHEAARMLPAAVLDDERTAQRAADRAEAQAAREAGAPLPFHGPTGYTGPRALCGYADHTAPALASGKLAEHERTPGTLGHCPGSLLTPRAHTQELTRAYTTAYSYQPPRDTFLACGAKPGDVVVWDGKDRTVQDCAPSGTATVLLTFTDDEAAFTVKDRLTYRRRVRRHHVPCQECGVMAPVECDEASDGRIVTRLCGVCDHPDATDPEHRAAVLAEATALITVRAAYATAHTFQPVALPDVDPERHVGWTFRTGYGPQARYGWVTSLGRLIPQVGLKYRWQAEQAVRDRHAAGTLAPTFHDPLSVLAARPLAEIRSSLEALRDGEAPAATRPAPAVLEAVATRQAGTTAGCAPQHAKRPDVIAALRALEGLRAARLTDDHDTTEPTEEQRAVRGFVVEPRGHGRVALYWLEEGQVARRDTPQGGGALASLEDRMHARGWTTEPMVRSSQCLFAHVPGDQPQG